MTPIRKILVISVALAVLIGVPASFADISTTNYGLDLLTTKLTEIITQINLNSADITAIQANVTTNTNQITTVSTQSTNNANQITIISADVASNTNQLGNMTSSEITGEIKLYAGSTTPTGFLLADGAVSDCNILNDTTLVGCLKIKVTLLSLSKSVPVIMNLLLVSFIIHP